LVPDQGVIKVYASTTGIVRQVLVQDRSLVSEGQALLMINGDRVLTSGEHLETVLLDEYQSQLQILESQLTRLPSLFSNKQLDLEQTIAATDRAIVHIQTQQKLLSQQLSLAERQKANIDTLSRQGLASDADLGSASEKLLSLQAQYQELARSLDAQRDLVKSLALQQAGLGFEELNRQGELQNSLSGLAQSIAQLHGERAYIVKANRAGMVSNIQVSEGQEVQSSVPLLTITPQGSELEAELLVPARAIGFVEVGQTVKMRYSAFTFQKFGLYNATITGVSQTVLLPSELSGVAINAQEPMYRVTARLEQQTVNAYGKAFPLKDGISLEADIKLAERSLLEWLFEPLLSLRGRL
jgi:membrane fusion protein